LVGVIVIFGYNFIIFCDKLIKQSYWSCLLVFLSFKQGCNFQPGKPAQNAYVEQFNRTFREDVLDAYLFKSIQEVNALAFEWQVEYNNPPP